MAVPKPKSKFPDLTLLDEVVSITDHDPAWFTWYAEEVAALANELSADAPKFEHIGSSAVNGLRSKPIVDILMGLQDLELSKSAQSALASLDYEYFGRLHAMQDRLFARKRGSRSFNLQITTHGGKEWREKIAFRDYLRAHPNEVELYSSIKDAALMAGKIKLLDYHSHKEHVVTSIFQRALLWASQRR